MYTQLFIVIYILYTSTSGLKSFIYQMIENSASS